MRTLLLLLSAICIQPYLMITCFAQETFSEINVKLNSVEDQSKQSYVLIDSVSHSFKVVLADYKNVYVYELDSTGKVLAEQKGEKPNYNHNLLLGATATSNTVSVYLSNSPRTSFSCLTFNKDEVKGRKISFSSGNERFLQAFGYRNNFYFITLKKYTSILTIYSIDDDGNLSPHVIDLTRYRFRNSSRNSLYTALSDTVNMTEQLVCPKIQTRIPNSFDEVKDGAKFYQEGNTLTLTLDNTTLYTIIISINLDNYSYKLNSFQQPHTSCEEGREAKSNSFLYHGYLYQVKFCNEEIHCQIYDTTKREPVGEHLVNAQNFEIFRNTYFSREGVGNESITLSSINFRRPSKNLDTTQVSIKKITKGQPAVSVFQSNGQNILSIGGIITFNMFIANSPMRGIGGAPVPGYNGGLSLHSEWAKYFRTMFDKNFNHQSGQIIPTVYDDIKIYEQSSEQKEVAKQLFLWKENCMFGYYDKELQKYVILKFKN